MTDIVERLRDADRRGVAPPQAWTTDAAYEIERLRAENKALRMAAQRVIQAHDDGEDMQTPIDSLTRLIDAKLAAKGK